MRFTRPWSSPAGCSPRWPTQPDERRVVARGRLGRGCGMPFIQITMIAGRTEEQKRDLLAAVSQATTDSIGAPPETVRAWIVEVPPTDIAVAGETHADRRARADQG
ncbi:hypothetical protein E9549_13120 [Blastococcus sp. MG754426]|uniref:tautomerase family protein n=1 Tax=unclassified Blastococcus TaxID=2619396 RepID=UPI0021048751|nr:MULTISPECIES: 2-hydroxymuconate tautomerase family protein [unclassified Blastococcus]MCF6508339.1 hypothetical protein [Blastococcus sp. MG754426]MCF6513047.1 hypothetical protein [Blastococcus sp. MG754427]MCF6734092.1 hypothetical protein [Blastococcus sp. KM273129]